MALNQFCPGGTSIKNVTPESIVCSNCGNELEIWTDEMKAKCPHCGTINCRDRAPSCIDWCSSAEACFGPSLYHRLKGPITPS